MGKYSARLREAGNPPIEVRIGVNTGDVVVRSIRTADAHTEYTPIGHSTSLAARMQTLAPTGSIAITEATRKFTAGYFELKALGQKWPRNFEQCDKWKLRAKSLAEEGWQEGVFDGQEIRAADAPHAHGGVQGAGSVSGGARGPDAGRSGGTV
jgi:class 3 adenylate cyclase